VGVGPLAHGLAGVGRSARLAGEIVDVLPEATGPCELLDAWLPLAGGRLADTAPELVDSVLGGLSDAPARERERLLDTVRRYAASGSVGEVAAGLYCHRNTVLNRCGGSRSSPGGTSRCPARPPRCCSPCSPPGSLRRPRCAPRGNRLAGRATLTCDQIRNLVTSSRGWV